MERLVAIATVMMLLGCGGDDPGEGTSSASNAPPPAPARNLILISLDTTRADRLGCYGYDGGTTPVLDALAQAGVRFDSAWTPMPITLPAHSALMTSRYPRGLGLTSNFDRLAPQEVTLAEQLKEAGFATAAFVSSRVLMKGSGLDQGFDVYQSPRISMTPADKLYLEARKWIGEHKDERFFVFLHHYDPHAAYEPPEPYRSRFGVGEHPHNKNPPWEVMAFMQQPELLTPEVEDQASRAYDAELAFTDAQIGRLIEDLRLVDLFDETLLVVVADHGETLTELAERYDYAFDHGEFLYPREIHVPMILHGPERFGLRGGGTHDLGVSLVDVAPTALEILGLESSQALEGRSLLPALLGETLDTLPMVSQRHRWIDGKLPHPSMAGEEYAIVVGRWLLIESDGRGREFFDLSQDPQALVDLSGSEPDRAARVAEFLEHWLEEHPEGAPAEVEISDERAKALDELGYGGGG